VLAAATFLLQESRVSAAVEERSINHLLDDLPRKERQRALERCESVELVVGTTLCEMEEQLRHVYFPISGFISLVTKVGGHKPLELGLIGNEGMLGVTAVLGVDSAPQRAVVQGAGTAFRMSKPQFDLELRRSPGLMRSLNRYLYGWVVQLSQNTACNRFHEVEARLARWLLMTHDRAHADHFHLTHEFLADMLGVRRSAVTIAAGGLRRRRLIQYARGEIRILDRGGLESTSCECYDAVRSHCARAAA
jgi:CRP-like cAMP-binding protein